MSDNAEELITVKETNPIGDSIRVFKKVAGDKVIFNDDGETLSNLELNGLITSERKRVANIVTQTVYYGKQEYKCKLTPDNELKMLGNVDNEEEIQQCFLSIINKCYEAGKLIKATR